MKNSLPAAGLMVKRAKKKRMQGRISLGVNFADTAQKPGDLLIPGWELVARTRSESTGRLSSLLPDLPELVSRERVEVAVRILPSDLLSRIKTIEIFFYYGVAIAL